MISPSVVRASIRVQNKNRQCLQLPGTWNPAFRVQYAVAATHREIAHGYGSQFSSLEGMSSPAPTHFEVTLPAEVSAITPVVSWVMRLLGELDYASGKEFEIEMALREALANAVLHGCKGDPSQKIDCSVTCDRKQGILIVVRDPGPGFDPKSIPSPTEDSNLHADHGRGILLINKLMDEVKSRTQRHRNPYAQILTAMLAKLPTKTPDEAPEKPAENKFDPFRPDMPQIPGVGPGPRQAVRNSGGLDRDRLLQIAGIAGAVLLVGALILMAGQEQAERGKQCFLGCGSRGPERARSSAAKPCSNGPGRSNRSRDARSALQTVGRQEICLRKCSHAGTH